VPLANDGIDHILVRCGLWSGQLPWRWRQYVRRKRRCPTTRMHTADARGVTTGSSPHWKL